MTDIKLKPLTKKKIIKEAGQAELAWQSLDKTFMTLANVINRMQAVGIIDMKKYKIIGKKIIDLKNYIDNV